MSHSENAPTKSIDNKSLERSDGLRKLVFQEIKEHRGTYFVHYSPAGAGQYFALLTLVFLRDEEVSEIAKLMEQECTIWMQRYQVPIMVSAFDDADNLIGVKEIRGCDHLIGVLEDEKPVYHWELLKDEEFPWGPLHESYLLDIYTDVPYTSAEERREKILAQFRAERKLFFVIAMWGIVVPAAVGIIGLTNPILGVVIVIYAVGKATYHALKMLGYVKKSKADKQKDAEELRMRHHHYHCERNPEGFMRLKAENFEREAQERTRKEAEEIKRGQIIEPGVAE